MCEGLRGMFLLSWPHAVLLVCSVIFPRRSSEEEACKLHGANCRISTGPLISSIVLTSKIIDQLR